VDAPTTVAALGQHAGPLDEHPDLTVPADVARDAQTIVDAALTEPQRAMLDFERRWWRQGGAKEQAIRDTFGLTPTRYYQTLNGVLDLPAAMSYDPTLVHRLLRLRTEGGRARRALD
jgi:hypothetical protein